VERRDKWCRCRGAEVRKKVDVERDKDRRSKKECYYTTRVERVKQSNERVVGVGRGMSIV
jgi:hypothetical protein